MPEKNLQIVDHIAFYFYTNEQEMLTALLESLPFVGFEEKEESLVAYLPPAENTDDFRGQLKEICSNLSLSYPEEQTIKAQNWNAQWEAAFQPMQVGNFAGIRAEFHPPFTDVKYQLLIHPRMAFGTGHHATTYMMMEKMSRLQFRDTDVFDYGCGTGILAILARKMGAKNLDAVDIELPSYENTLQNMEANAVTGIQVFHGDITAVPSKKYEIILANINRNVILNSLPALSDRLRIDGDLIVSGILQKDFDKVDAKAKENSFKACEVKERDGWLMIHYKLV